MARQRRSRDWQERAFDERERQRRHAHAGESDEMPDPLKVSTDLPRRNQLRWAAIGLVIIVIVVVVHDRGNSHAPALTTSCSTPAMALSSTSVHRGSTVRWSVTGPPRSTLVITIGISALTGNSAVPGQLKVTSESGDPTRTELAVKPGTLDSSCTAHGVFGVNVPTGSYTVRLFRLTDPSTARVSAASVATKPLTVTSG